MSKVIRISNQIFTRLQEIAEPLTDTPATVIERLLDFYEENYQSDGKFQKAETFIDEDFNIERFDPETPPNLKHSRVNKVMIGNSTLSGLNWQKTVRYIHCLCMKQAKTFDALQMITTFDIEKGNRQDKGFYYVPEIGISIRNVDSNVAWKGIFTMAKKISIPIAIYFEWRDKPEAENPGGKGLLSWSPD
ncbi:T4SS efffector SepA family protein [Limnoraphis robusta]|uniref:Uncharacterized protein n=1 Tax=Limnoraphis robusta CCNP1315 TaxID=3110306 RepID=A0ABU5U4N6_9CYAN|nr:hypothetical protein [Limnoraphis robusta]MEA5522158.1 hypothetical protein [Limnoraphis robusta CCNP1315]MEA5544278.1 hypothetical protein [Limnoraphis robusta CCNP1324]